MKIVIIGAGPTGLGAAHRLHELSHDSWMIFEKNNYPGGLAASFRDAAGFTWDTGGHVLFSHYQYFDNIIIHALGGAYFEHLRESWIRVLNTWVPYPFQNNIHRLPADPLKECVDGLRQVQQGNNSNANFQEWLMSTFGSGIVKYFMQPYNLKVWGVPLQSMSSDWVGDRVNIVDLARIEKNISEGCDDTGWGPNNTFKFPKKGGTGSIFQAIAEPFLEHIHLTHELNLLDMQKKEIMFTNGRKECYDILINTMPLDLLIQHSVGCPDTVMTASHNLIHNSGLIVCLGLESESRDTKGWMYFPEQHVPFYRVTNFHNYSPYNVPSGNVQQYRSLMCETTYSAHRPEDKSSIIERTIKGLGKISMFTSYNNPSKIISRYLIDVPYSYPVPTIGRNAALDRIQSYLETQNIFSRGRFGAWKYEVGNMDHSFMQGVEIIDRILNGKEEKVITGKA